MNGQSKSNDPDRYDRGASLVNARVFEPHLKRWCSPLIKLRRYSSDSQSPQFWHAAVDSCFSAAF